MAKEILYRGKTVEEMQAMPIDEFAKIVPSRARRSITRGMDQLFVKKIMKARELTLQGKPPIKPLRTHQRQFVILPQMVGLKFAVHKGNAFDIVEIQPEMVGHRLGEYVLTRKRITHGKAGLGSTKSSSAVSK
ncbi:MAG: 30S ribosomal protein S19 [Candidatus Diapherotrites archaeon]|nr:30S ribosomal protein S19 [Candidatus Diapherotrites archaeon]MDZ4256634.1 30S ribosomal protein S19 [archaeon]